jgi:hypothetical protein
VAASFFDLKPTATKGEPIMARNVRQIDDDDSFDENGILRDGHVARVRMMTHDGGDNLTDLQRSILSDAAIKDAFAMRDASARSFGLRDGLSLSRPGFRYNTSDAADTNREKLYDGYQQDMGQRWRGADNVGQAVACTVRSGAGRYGMEGSPGIMRMIDGELRCVADDRSNDGRRDSQTTMDAEYAAYDARMTQAWRTPS